MPANGIADEARKRISDSMGMALKFAESASSLIGAEAGSELIYKEIMKTRLEVQYSLAMMQLGYSIALHPKKGRAKGDLFRSILAVSAKLKSAEETMAASRMEEAVPFLLEADAMLAHMIASMRRLGRSHVGIPGMSGNGDIGRGGEEISNDVNDLGKIKGASVGKPRKRRIKNNQEKEIEKE